MKLNELPKIKTRGKKRLGRGFGSGKGGHTVGRGQKGQKTRGKISPLFEGTKIKKSLIKRLPLLRGKGKLKSKAKPVIVKLAALEMMPAGSLIDIDSLIKSGIVGPSVRKSGVKLLGGGKLSQKLTVKISVSKGARAQIEKAGGKIER